MQSKIFGVDYGKISGIAPRAQIIAYKALGEQGGTSIDLASAIDQAIADHVDVINYSIGGGAGIAGADTFEFLLAQSARVFVAVSAGNSGPAAATIGGPADVPWVTSVGANTQARSFKGTVILSTGRRFGWGPGQGGLAIRGASVTQGTTSHLALVDGETAGSAICEEGGLDPARVAGAIVLCLRGGNGRVAKSLAVKDAGGVGMVLYNATDQDNLFTDDFWVPSVMVSYSAGALIKAFVSYIPQATATLRTGGEFRLPAAPSVTAFSSRGPDPSAGDIIKPDITAPGIQVLAGNSPFAPAADSASGQLFQAIAGTSMSSPVVAGMFALIKQQHPDWTPAEARSALMTTAYTKVGDTATHTQAGPFAMGAGMVDIGMPGVPGSAFDPGLVYDAGTLDYLGFLCEADPVFLAALVPFSCNDLDQAGVPITSADLNLPSIGVRSAAGVKTVTRTVTSVADTTITWRARVTAPAGWSVVVSPSKLTLKPGASASFTVTFTNTGTGPIGAYSTGSLTWSSSVHGYAARIPVAVQGTRLDAPSALTGSGTSGSTTFTEQFGYSGKYTATAHGLVAPTGLDGVVKQDPDQLFPSPDDGAGVVRIPVHLAADAVARWSIVFPATDPDDIDLYLLDSTDKIIAVSGRGGTDEEIQLVAPADGDYTLVVHGWAISEPAGRAFSVQQWLVPLAPGPGNLTVTAPAVATTGATADVTVAWNGLTAGTAYLGAVSHADADGIFQLTVVDITA